MIKKYSEILIDICREIDFEYDVLMDLSEKNKENTVDYTNNLCKLRRLLDKSIEYCRTFSVETLQNMLYYITEKLGEFESCYYYEIASSIIDHVLNKYYIEQRTGTDDTNEEETEYDDAPLNESEVEEANRWLEAYPDYLDDYYDEAMGIIYTSVARKIFIELINLKPETKKEKELQIKLLKLYNSKYKYDFLTKSVSLELMAVDARFNPFRIYIHADEEFSSMYFNESIDILKTICNRRISSLDTESLEDCFEIMCLFEMLDYLNIEQLNKLKEACIEFTNSKSPNTLGKLCLSKLQSKTDE